MDRPTVVQTEGALVRLNHRSFAAEIDPINRRCLLRRDPGLAFPLEVALRVTICSYLPLIGVVPLHAAGIEIDGAGVCFFGPSGAGKTTISEASPYPIVSDELVLASAHPPTLSSASFFATEPGTHRGIDLAAFVELAKGSGFSMTELGRTEAAIKMMQATMVPTSSILWNRSLALLAELIRDVPVMRMEWSPNRSPWTDIVTRIDRVRSARGLDRCGVEARGGCH